MAEELKPCPFCSCTDIGEVTINLILEQRHRRFKVYCKACQCRTSEHKTRKEARIYWNTRAQLPRQVGEAVEVVAWRTNRDEDSTFPRLHKTEQEAKHWVDVCNVAPAITHEPLMTVAQHQRILAALTRPADQVAEGVVVPVQLLKIIEQSWRIPNGCPKSVSEEVGEIISNGLADLRALLAKGEGVKP